ncbi:putative multidrug resistance protein [Tasmannia lanceolata]|uniref:putative multidrug resistance protein n=1 Tax=Tasmannia lanceolata TaxID=3420 RepID=UPI004064924C
MGKEKEKKERVSIFQLFRYSDGIDKWLVFGGIMGCIGDGLMNPINMWILSGTINVYGTADNSLSYRVVDEKALKLMGVAFFVGISAFIEGVCWSRTAERQVSRMRTMYLKSVLRQDVGFFDTNAATSTTYEVVSTISSDAHVIQGVLAEKIPNFIANSSAFVFSLVVAFLLSWRLALAGLPFTLTYIIPGVICGKLMMDMAVKAKVAYGVAGGIADQAVSSVRTVVSYVSESRMLTKFSHALEQSTKLGIKQGLMKGLAIGCFGMVYAVWSHQAWVGSVLVTEMGAQGGQVFVAAICVILGGIAVMSAFPNLTSFSEAVAAASRIFEMIDRLPAIDSDDQRGIILQNVRGEIEFKNVHFTYPSRPDSPVLQGFNLRVNAGMTIGLVGGSGSGKSTVISLLERFYDPIRGDILLDGKNIKRFQLKWLRSQMSLVSQEPVLFATSIIENILFGNDRASMDLVVNAAKAANAHNFIIKLPDGYDTQVGQLGTQISGGQKQRIAIARAILKDPRILLLDEATSALDAESERVVQDALDQASVGRTTIIIAHRLSTLRKANLIAVVQSGKVVESGSHDQLSQMNDGEGGAYATMVKMQQSTIKNEGSSSYHSLTGQNNSPDMLDMMSYHNIINMMSPSIALSSRYTSPAQSFVQGQDYSDPNEGDDKEYYPSPSQWHLLKMASPEWRRALMGCVGAITFGAVHTIHAYCLGSALSVYFLNNNDLIKSKIKVYSFIFLTLAFMTLITNIIQHYNFAVMGERLTKRIREKLLEKMLTFEIGWFDKDENSSAAICARLATEANTVRALVGDRLSLLLQVFTTASSSFILALVITWRLSIVMIAMQPLIIGSFYSRGVLMRNMSEKSKQAQNAGSQLASEAVVNHRTITAYSSQERILGLYEVALKAPRKEIIKQSWFSGLGLFVSQFLSTAGIALTYWYGGRLMIQGLVTPKHIFQVFFLLMSTGKQIADAGMMSSDLAKGSNAVKSVFAILNRQTKIDPDGIKSNKMIKGRVELKNVLFSYPARPEQTIFRGLSIKIEAGNTVALVGESGSGKSTIIGLIERFYDPLKGSVEIDGRDIKSYNLRLLRSHIALVSQEPTLFAGSIHENIAYGKEKATESEIMEAAVLANAHQFISSMKDGYETYCGERGVQLSGGQKQRIALARAILKKPVILLLDEATSALDTVSESLVQEALDKMMMGRTCVVVAHRLSTIQKAETIAVIKNGKIVEQGSHSQLLAIGRRGAYYSLIKLQQGNNSHSQTQSE